MEKYTKLKSKFIIQYEEILKKILSPLSQVVEEKIRQNLLKSPQDVLDEIKILKDAYKE
jgi:hypothetical protein